VISLPIVSYVYSGLHCLSGASRKSGGAERSGERESKKNDALQRSGAETEPGARITEIGWSSDRAAFLPLTLRLRSAHAPLRGAWTQLHQTWREHRAIIVRCIFVLEFGYIAAFSNAGSLKLSDVENDAKFRSFRPREN